MLALKLRYFRSEEYQNSLHSRSLMVRSVTLVVTIALTVRTDHANPQVRSKR